MDTELLTDAPSWQRGMEGHNRLLRVISTHFSVGDTNLAQRKFRDVFATGVSLSVRARALA
jgi:hypothetical protein